MVTQGDPGPRPSRRRRSGYRPIRDYALIGDCHSAGLVSSEGSIDWCTFPRFDSGSCFARILDAKHGGFCSVAPVGRFSASRRYLDQTMVLETTFRSAGGEVVLQDCFTMREGGRRNPHRQIVRVLECTRGQMDIDVWIEPRFDYGEVLPWIRHLGSGCFAALGGNDALVVEGDPHLQPVGRHELGMRISLRAGRRSRVSMTYMGPELVDTCLPVGPQEIDERLEETIEWWNRWSKHRDARSTLAASDPVIRSSVVLKALTFAPTGAIVAAPTTSLPETIGGQRNWDYRFSWIRDSNFTVGSLAGLGHVAEADGFRRFVERSSAGSAEDLRIVYGVGGEHRIGQSNLPELEGYRGSRPVRVGNGAVDQQQLDVFGHVLDLAYSWHLRGHSPDDDYWRFLVDVVDAACDRWPDPDFGMWEVQGEPQHFVQSKAMAWAALDRGIRLANESMRRAPIRRWAHGRDACRRAIETKGYDRSRGVFVRAFGSGDMDASLLLLPEFGFIAWDDERMIRTVDAIREDLEEDGLLRRYRADDGIDGNEGVFLACSFWLVECLVRQGRLEEASEVFGRVTSMSNEVGLFSEEYDTRSDQMLGNFPQGLTHLSHISAALALEEHLQEDFGEPGPGIEWRSI
jgi:GH15 family glucan-1,4-alpha-glucosidase